LAVQTNNATFGTSSQSKQQLAIARVRAIEHQKSIVSISTSGVSAFIDNLGNIGQETDLNTSATIDAKISLQNGTSISDRLGNRAEAVLIFIPTLLWFIVRRMRAK
jgi:apolipoprotein N-acyltransferase